MKGKDVHGLFEVFRPGVRDDLSFPKKCIYWFTNVYWYHFKVITLLVIFAIILAVVFVGDLIHRPNDDLGLILAGDGFFTVSQQEQLSEKICGWIEDANGDGTVTIAYQALCTSVLAQDVPEELQTTAANYDEFTRSNEQKLAISFADDQFQLYFMDEAHMRRYAEDGAFEPLETFGISAEDSYCIPISDSALFRELGLTQLPGGTWYAGIKMINESRAKSAKIQAKYEQAVAVLRHLAEQ